MRILRGQSNLEVSSKGFAWFVVGLVLATFAGGAARTVLNSTQLHDRIVTELKNRFPRHEFQIGQTEILLSRGIWPGLALRVHDVTFKQEVCGKLSFLLTLPQTTLPVDILSLVRGTLRLNDIEIEGGNIHLDYHECPSAAAESHAADRDKSGGESSTPVRALVIPKTDWHDLARFADGLEIKNFAVTYEKSPTWKLMFNSAYLSLGTDMSAQALVDVQKSLDFGTLAQPVEFDLRGDSNVLHWNFTTDFKEGHVRLNGSVDLNNQAGLIKVDFRQVPVSDLMTEAYQMGFANRELKLKATWVTCALKWEGQLQKFAESPINMHECRIEGGYGRADLDHADLQLNGPELFKDPAHVKITQLQIQPMVEALDRQVLPAVLSRLGVWTGSLDLKGNEAWTLDGHLENAEIVFSNQSVMGKQVVETLHTNVKRVGAKIAARVDDVRIHDGGFAGGIDFDLNSDWRDGVFRAQIDKLSLSPQIQRLMMGGSMAPLEVHGQGTLSGGELGQWTGTFALPEVHGEGWAAQNLAVKSHFQKGIFHIEGTAKALSAESGWRAYPQLKLVRPEAPDPIAWHDLNVKVDIQKTGGSLQSATLVETPGNTTWKGKGTWVRDGDFKGTLSVSGGGVKAKTFTLLGEKNSLSVEDEPGVTR